MRLFVTGGTGFIGRRVVRQLRSAGHDVVALVRSSVRGAELEQLGITTVLGDVTDKESMRDAMRGVDGVIHLAAWYRIGSPDRLTAERANILGTRNVLELMRELSVPKGVYVSSLAVNSHTRGVVVDEHYRYFGPHLSLYDKTKWRAHYEVAEPMMSEGLPLVIVQPGLVYGSDDRSLVGDTLRRYLMGRLPVAPKGTAFCFAHVDDVARGILLALERGRTGENYFLCGPPMSFVAALELCEKITGRKAPRVLIPPAIMKLTSLVVRLVESVVTLPPIYSSEALRVNAGTTYLGSDAKARRELGFTTRPLEEGFREMLFDEMKRLGLVPR
ncbi:MAG: epimerase [Ignavibacteria bacterium]